MQKVALFCCVLAPILAATGFPEPFYGRIIGGVLADQGEYPTQLTLHLNDEHWCGASIISETFALTAAHCVLYNEPQNMSARSGSVDVNGGERHQVTKIFMHENFDFFDSLIHDIAVVEVSPPFTYGPNVQPIKLPSQDEEFAPGTPATVLGWGRISEAGPQSFLLREVDIEVRDHQMCEQVYADIGMPIYPGHLCADAPEGNLGSCNGDSGGPLIVDGTVIGLVSWANGCSNPGYPTIYSRVAYYRDWINQQTGI